MSYATFSTEQDPLLPKDEQAPEVMGSRPTSLKSFYDVETEANIAENEGEDEDDFDPKRHLVNDVMAMIFGIALLFSIVFIFLPNGFWGDKPGPQTVEQRVHRILTDTPLIDGHNDFAILIRFYFDNQLYTDKFKKLFEEGGMPMHVDLPRLKKGMNGGAFWSAWAPCPKDGMDFSDANYLDSVAFTLAQIDALTRLQAAYPKVFSPQVNSSTALKAFKSGQFISPIIIEGLHQIANSISNLRHYHSLGVRYATLTHNCHNKYADAALVETPNGVEKSKPVWNGVSDAGKDLIFEMNRLGMIVDLSHVSQDTMRDVLIGKEGWKGSAAPIMFSHSSAYTICPHPRNVPDDILQLVKEKNGVVMVNFAPDFISCVANTSNPSGIPDFFPANNTLDHVVTHVMHIGDLIGYDHVGFGSDFDGIGSIPEGLEDVSKYPDLVAALLKKGVSDEDAAKIVGGNILRVWKDVDAVALEMQKAGVKPVEDKLPSLRGEMLMNWETSFST
ncbi:membrane dipeptidase-like protein [Mollisia scopiformis]|uniref:Dipeptidase n=1 Tax=Mollisia scopiformis TaxID=149040 RepID=A0A132B6U8_MOLSC|nr:membrane dipeptidase-like protein [Mollisia scopiformis]KUJ07729.1 membrane dipeptidase-like protein [Mollisia scopiformis]